MMNNIDENLLKELESLQLGEQFCNDVDDDTLLRIHNLTLQKAGLQKTPSKKSKRIKFVRIAASAAVAVFAVLGMGAAYLHASDFFKNSMMAKPQPQMANDTLLRSTMGNETASNKSAAVADAGGVYSQSAESFAATVNPMGNVVRQRATDQNIEMTAQAAMGDKDTLMVSVDVKSLAGSLPDNAILSNILLSVSDEKTGIGFEQTLSDVQVNNIEENTTVNFLIKDKIQEAFIGKTATLTVGSLGAFTQAVGEEMDIGSPLYNIFTDNNYAIENNLLINAMSEKDEKNLKENGQEIQRDENGTAIWGYSIHASERKPLTDHDFTVNTMQIKNDVFYISLSAKTAKILENLQSIALKNIKTGEVLYGGTSWGDWEDDNYISVEIEGIHSAQDLKNYVLMQNCGAIVQTIAKGNWEFNIPVEFNDTSVVFPLNYELKTDDNITLFMQTVAVSPISITVRGKCTNGDFGYWHGFGDEGFCLLMSDGTKVELDSMSSCYDYESGAFDISFVLPCVIEPQKLKTIKINEILIDISPK
ncbi:MAG: hypothetical protein RR902_00165 [Oscillospiraceae bacterium]